MGGSVLRGLNRHRNRVLASTALVAGVLMVSGCAASAAEPSATPKRAEETTTTETVDAAIAAIDPDLIDHVDPVMNTSVGCLGGDGNPSATERAWRNMRYVWLVSGTEAPAVAAALIQTYEENGWNAPPNQAEEPDDSRSVLLTREDDAGFELGVSTPANTSRSAVIYLSSTSPCFDEAGIRDSQR